MENAHGFHALGVVGSGAMGRGIAQLFAQAGVPTKLFDSHLPALAAAVQSIHEGWQSLCAKGRLSPEAMDQARSMLQPLERIEDLKDCDLVIEAIVEEIGAKKELFRVLEAIAQPHAVLASNTSSLSITALANGLQVPERVVGLHFFNPVPLMRVVEVVAGARTAPHLPVRLAQLVEASGHRAVLCSDTPGFIVNHAGRAYVTEALKILGEKIAPFHVVDRILREQVTFGGQGFRLGPFELLDLTGLDVSHPVMESIYTQFYHEARFRPSVITAQRNAAGLLGRKSSEGFYAYRQGGKVVPDWPWPSAVTAPAEEPGPSDPPVWIAPLPPAQPAGVFEDLVQYFMRAGVRLCGAQARTSAGGADPGPSPANPPEDALILLCPLGEDASAMATRLGVDARRAMALDTLFAFGWGQCKLRCLMSTPATSQDVQNAAYRMFSRDGAALAILQDSPGFVSQRILAMIVAIACDMAQQAVGSPQDIDDAVRIGLAYPAGPLSMGDALGAARIHAVLTAMHACTADPRYRPSPWLRRRADLNLKLLVQA